MKPSRNIIKDRSLEVPYLDTEGRQWDVALLDRLLRERLVRQRVSDLYRNAYDDTRTEGFDFYPPVAWTCLKREFKRDEDVAFYLLLVVRYRPARIRQGHNMKVLGRLHCACGPHEGGEVMGFTGHCRSFVDRTGREYNQDELKEAFEKVYPISPKALRALFPYMPQRTMEDRARRYGLTRPFRTFKPHEDAICRELWPDYNSIAALLGRKRLAVERRCQVLKLTTRLGAPYTAEEVAQLRAGLEVPGRSRGSNWRKRARLGVKKRDALKVRALGFTA